MKLSTPIGIVKLIQLDNNFYLMDMNPSDPKRYYTYITMSNGLVDPASYARGPLSTYIDHGTSEEILFLFNFLVDMSKVESPITTMNLLQSQPGITIKVRGRNALSYDIGNISVTLKKDSTNKVIGYNISVKLEDCLQKYVERFPANTPIIISSSGGPRMYARYKDLYPLFKKHSHEKKEVLHEGNSV